MLWDMLGNIEIKIEISFQRSFELDCAIFHYGNVHNVFCFIIMQYDPVVFAYISYYSALLIL